MEELLNKFNAYPPEEQEKLLVKYRDLISLLYKNIDENEIKLILYCLDYMIKDLNINHKEESKNIKAWCTVILMRRLKNKSINSEKDIINIISKTIEHFKKEEYSIYLNDIDMFNNEYVRDHEYLNKLII